MSKFNDKAVALKYQQDRDRAPIIVAAGGGHVAQTIIELANSNGVPIYKDTTTATILSQLKIGQEIPVDLYGIIANIYVAIMETANEIKHHPRQTNQTLTAATQTHQEPPTPQKETSV